jgi:hypothetical protein
MTFPHRCHAPNDGITGIAGKIGGREIVESWRKLARPVTFFDLCSPSIFFGSKIREFFRKKCARRDSNAGPPA